MEYDAFISHASEDKDAVVRELAEELSNRGFRIWYDELTLKVGDSLRRSIDKGLSSSRFGIVILSPAFFEKEWPQKELDGLTSREVDGTKVILPVWHQVNQPAVAEYSPTLADRIATSTGKGISGVADDLTEVLASGRDVQAGQEEQPEPVQAGAATAIELARQLQGEIDASQTRESFFGSERGVKAADAEFNRFTENLKRIAAEISEAAPAFSFRHESRQRSFVLSSSAVSLSVSWVREWANTLRDSELQVRLWDGVLSLGGRVTLREPQVIQERTFDFEMADEGLYGWREIRGKYSFRTSKELADQFVQAMMARIAEQRKR